MVGTTRSTRPPSPVNDIEEWWMDGGVVADLPIPPMADQIAAMSTAIVGHFTALAATMTSAPPLATEPQPSGRPVLVLRV
jgi:predicted acylesterase/phospholipase RssA